MLHDPPHTRFFLWLPDQSKIELQRVGSSTGSDGRDYYLIVDDYERLYERLRNAATKRIDPLGIEPTSVKDTNS